MSKIKDEKTAKEMFGYSPSFGTYDLSLVAEEKKDLSQDELIEEVSDKETKTALQERKKVRQQEGRKRGRPRKEGSQEVTRMTFIVNKVQLEKIREIGYRETLFTKEILYSALQKYIADYERKNGEVIPQGKSKL